jgi:hypothetical protein
LTKKKRYVAKNESDKEEVLLTKSEVQEVFDFYKFAVAQSGFSNVITPDLLAGRMKDVSMNPMAATDTTLAAAMTSPKSSEKELMQFSENFELQSMPYKRLIDYISGMLAWDYTYTSDVEEKEYDSGAYKKDLKIVENFFNRFDHKKEFSSAVRQEFRNEAFFCTPRFDGDQIVLQELPSSPDYTKITGRWDYGLLFSFNMLWFIQPGVSIDMYPEFFRKKYLEYWKDGNINSYMPALSPLLRGSSSWVYWQDVPVDVGWCWKLNPEIIARVPYFTPLFPDLINQALMRNLQKNINMATANKMIIGEVPFLKDAAAKVKDQISMTPETLGKFLQLVRSAISDALKFTAAPLNNIQGIEFKSENLVYDSYLRTSLASSGINSNLIFSSDIKPNSVETQLSLNVDEQIVTKLYSQFEAFLNYHVNRFTKKYKFHFKFEGTNFYTNRESRFNAQIKLLPLGIVLPQKVAASIGLSPFEFERQLAEGRANKWVDKLTPIISGAQMPAEGAGAPTKPDSKIGDEGETTRANSRNVGRGGKK